MREVEIAVVGAGPAGLAAALEAARAGAKVVLIDEYHTPGGQFYKQVPGEFSIRNVKAEGAQYSQGTALIRALQATSVEFLSGTLVWGIFEEKTLALYRDDATELLRAQQLILAPGAQEVPIAFPGWTLPGVMMGGAAQAFLVSQRLLPGRRVIMAGAGPLQLKVASQFVDAGAEVVDILEASNNPPVSMENALRSLGHWGKMREGLDYWFKLKRARVPYHHRNVPVRVLGTDSLEAVVVAEVDENWKVRAGTERTLQADTLCLSYGFLPSNQLTRSLACRLTYCEQAGGWITWHDENQQTSVQGVFVAGEVGGIGGADVAEEQGRIAGLSAARACGRLSAEECRQQEQRARKQLIQAQHFADLTSAMMSLKPAIYDLITDDTIVCRCEDVTAGDVKRAIADGDHTVRGVKIRTRAGMGRCQGRMCSLLIRQLIARETGLPIEEIRLDTQRPPIKPIPVFALAGDPGTPAYDLAHSAKVVQAAEHSSQ